MSSLDTPDIDEVVITTLDGKDARVLPLEIWFDAPASKSSGEWKLRAFDLTNERDLTLPMRSITSWRPAA